MPATTLDIFRYQPDTAQAPYRQSFEMDHGEDLTLLDAILRLQDEQDGTLAIRYSCRSAICGSCACKANGKTVLDNTLVVIGTEYGLDHGLSGVFHALAGGHGHFKSGFFSQPANVVDFYDKGGGDTGFHRNELMPKLRYIPAPGAARPAVMAIATSKPSANARGSG